MIWWILLVVILIQCVIGVLVRFGIIFEDDIDLAIKIGGIPTVLICAYDAIWSLFVYYPCRSKNGKIYNMYCTLFDIETNRVPTYIIVRTATPITFLDILRNRMVYIGKVINSENKKLKR